MRIRDQCKNRKIAEHSKDIKYFIRFSYNDRIDRECVLNKFIEEGIMQAEVMNDTVQL